MRLFLIDKPGCHHMSDLIKGISSVYQLETEFYPYLSVEFIPNREDPPGIILLAGKEKIRKYYTFDDPNDIEELRLLIWKYLVKYHKPVNIAKDGCITDFRKTRTNKVIQGWQAKKKQMLKKKCCKDIRDMIVSEFAAQVIKHDVYRVNTTNKLDKNLCKKVRYEECGNNYPPNSHLFKRCVDEVNWLCNNGYPINKRADIIIGAREKLKKNIIDYLVKNNMKVNKQVLDTILSAGFFERARNRMGNKSANFTNASLAVDSLLGYDSYIRLIEGFNQNKSLTNITNISNIIPIIFIIIIIILLGRYF